MARSRTQILILGLGLMSVASVLSAQSTARDDAETTPAPNATATTPAVTPAGSPVFAPAAERAPSPVVQKRARPISGSVAAALAAASPRYEPPPKREPARELVDMREIDRPKNRIIRLPKVIVQEPRPPVFRERDVHTEKGLTEIAMRRYISDADRALNRFTLPLFGTSSEARALAMYAEEERLQNMSDLDEAARNASLADEETGTYIRRESRKTYLRSSDFGWSSGEPR